jgi:hypothetical protein
MALLGQIDIDLKEAMRAKNAPKLSVLLNSFHKPLPGMAAELPMEPYSAFIAKITK